MTDRGPRGRTANSDKSEQSHRGEARRFLGGPMATTMIRGLDDEERARAWLGVANELHQKGEVGSATVEQIAERVAEASGCDS